MGYIGQPLNAGNLSQPEPHKFNIGTNGWAGASLPIALLTKLVTKISTLILY
jgi:hypothetical protein